MASSVSIYNLPCELVALVAEQLDLQDLASLAFTCRHFHGNVLFNNSIARMVLEVSCLTFPSSIVGDADDSQRRVPSILETHEARNGSNSWARSLRRCLKRLLAIASAQPFQVAVVATADNFIYSSGMLCYSTSRQHIRLRDLRYSSTDEIEIDSLALLNEAHPVPQRMAKYSFWPIFYSEGTLSCIYQHRIGTDASSHMVVIDPHRHEVIKSWQFSTSGGYPVIRNNRDRLLFMERQESHGPGQYQWTVKNLDLHTKEWAQAEVRLPSLTGDFIGKTVCFGIIGDHLYAVCSDPRRYAPDTADWTSTYLVVRILLSNMKKSEETEIWRRKHEEGPINDAWTALKVERDPRTGIPTIIEVRMEWLRGESPSVRTCYKTQIFFPEEGDSLGKDRSGTPSSQSSGDDADSQISWPPPTPQLPRVPEFMHRDGAEDTFPRPSTCFIRSYLQLGDVFVDLRTFTTSDGSPRLYLQTISRPSPRSPNTINTWPSEKTAMGGESPEPSDVLIPGGFSYKTPRAVMDDRIVVYGLQGERTGRHGDMFPIVMVSFDPTTRIADRHWPSGNPDSLTEPVVSRTSVRRDANKMGGGQSATWARVVPASTHERGGLPSSFNLAYSSAVPNL